MSGEVCSVALSSDQKINGLALRRICELGLFTFASFGFVKKNNPCTSHRDTAMCWAMPCDSVTARRKHVNTCRRQVDSHRSGHLYGLTR